MTHRLGRPIASIANYLSSYNSLHPPLSFPTNAHDVSAMSVNIKPASAQGWQGSSNYSIRGEEATNRHSMAMPPRICSPCCPPSPTSDRQHIPPPTPTTAAVTAAAAAAGIVDNSIESRSRNFLDAVLLAFFPFHPPCGPPPRLIGCPRPWPSAKQQRVCKRRTRIVGTNTKTQLWEMHSTC